MKTWIQTVRVVLLSLLAITMLVPQLALAQGTAEVKKSPTQRCADFKKQFEIRNPTTGEVENLAGTMPGYCTVTELAGKVIQIMLLLAGIAATLFIIIGGFQYLTAGGNSEQAEKGRNTLTNAIIGLVVIMLASVIVRLVVNTITTGSIFGTTSSVPATTTPPGADVEYEYVPDDGAQGGDGTENPGGQTGQESGTGDGAPDAGSGTQATTLDKQAADASTFTVERAGTKSIKVSIEALISSKQAMCNVPPSKFNEVMVEVLVNGRSRVSMPVTTDYPQIISVDLGETVTTSQQVSVKICGIEIGGGPKIYTPTAR